MATTKAFELAQLSAEVESTTGLTTLATGIVSSEKIGAGIAVPLGNIHSKSTINNLLILESEDSNADIVGVDSTGSTRLRSAAGAFSFWIGGDAGSTGVANGVDSLTIGNDGVITVSSTASSTSTSTGALVVVGGAGIAENLNVGGDLTVTGDLTVEGTQVSLNTTALDVEDKNITLNYHASNDTSASADGAGITIQDAVDSTTDATILWNATNDAFDFSHEITAPSALTLTSNAPRIFLYEADTTDLNTALFSSGGAFTIRTTTDDDSTRTTRLQVSHSTGDISFYENNGGTPQVGMHWDYADGRLGVGTNSPTSVVDIRGPNGAVQSRGQLYLTNTDTAAIDNGSQISLGGTYSGTGDTYFAAIAGRKENSTVGDYHGYLQLSTRQTSGNIERMRITSDGRVGIGTNSPDALLDLKGVTASSSPILRFTGTGNASQGDVIGQIEFYNSDTTDNSAGIMGKIRAVAGPSGGEGSIQFLVDMPSEGADANKVALHLNANGNVGIGTESPDALLHISDTSPHIDVGPQGGNRGKIGYHDLDVIIGSTSSTGEIIFKNNISSTDAPQTSGDMKVKIHDVGMTIYSDTYNILDVATDTNDDQTSTDGIIKITNGASHTTKAEFRWDESEDLVHVSYGDHGRHVSINSSGNVGIGTGSVSPAHTLDVDGAIATRQVRHSIRPTLNLDFANSKQLDPRITFYRDSIATYYDSKGVLRYATHNKPRFDYDPATGESKGLLIEESRTNIVPESTHFGTFSTSRCVKISTYEVAPDGTFSALYIASNGSASSRVIHDFSMFTPAANSTYTVSVYAKSVGSDDTFSMELGNGANNVNVFFDLSNGTVTNETVSGTMSSVNGSIENVGNGWFRCIAAAVHGASWNQATNLAFYDQDNTDANSGILVWGPQVEEGAFATSYIPSDTRFTSRSSVATYHDETGVLRKSPANSPRYGYKYDGRKWVETGLILENASTNLFQGYTTTNKYRTTIVNNTSEVVSPDGSNSAMKLTPTDASAFNYTVFAIGNNSLNGSQQCGSIYAKKGSERYLWMSVSNSGGSPSGEPNCTFDLETGTVARAGDIDIARIENVGNGWYRCSVAHSIDGTGSSNQFVVSVASTNANRSSANSLYVVFPQIEESLALSSYIYWDGSGTTTRSADVVSSTAYTRETDIAKIYNFSDHFNSEELTAYLHASSDSEPETNARYYEGAQVEGNSDNRMLSYYNSQYRWLWKSKNNNDVVFQGSDTWSAFNEIKQAVTWKNGVANLGDSTGNSQSDTTAGSKSLFKVLHIGNDTSEGSPICAHFKKLTFYEKALSAAELQALTENN